MQLYELKQELKNGKIRNFYILNGPENVIKGMYINKIVNLAQTPLLYADNLKSILAGIQNYSLLHDKTVYVISDDKDLLEVEKNWSILKNLKGSVIIILTFNNLRKTSKFYKYFESDVIDFELMTIEQLAKIVKKELNLNDKFCEILAELSERHYGRLLLECNKLKHYIQVNNYTNNDQAFMDAIEQNLIYQPSKDVTFELVNDVLTNSKRKAFQNLREFKDNNDNVLGLISLLYSNFRQLLMVQALDGKDNIADRTGLTSFQVKIALQRCGIYTTKEIIRNLEVLRKLDADIKIGRVDTDIAAELALCLIMK